MVALWAEKWGEWQEKHLVLIKAIDWVAPMVGETIDWLVDKMDFWKAATILNFDR